MSWVSVPFKKEHCVCCSNWPRFICIVSIFLAGVDAVKLLIDVSDTVWKIVAYLSFDSLNLLSVFKSAQRNQSCSWVLLNGSLSFSTFMFEILGFFRQFWQTFRADQRESQLLIEEDIFVSKFK